MRRWIDVFTMIFCKSVKVNNMVIRYLPQNPVFSEQETVLEAVLRGNRTIDNESHIEADAKAI